MQLLTIPRYYIQLKTSKTQRQPIPSAHATAAATFHTAGVEDVKAAIDSALAAKKEWESMSFADRASVFLKAADLVSTKYRYEIMAATMVGQGKNAWQAEIDAAAELCDFFRLVLIAFFFSFFLFFFSFELLRLTR